MAEFLADIAGLLELFAIAAGLTLLYYASKHGPALLLKVAGWVLLVGGIAIGLCTSYYWFTYRSLGMFAHAQVHYPGMEHPGAPWMSPGTMGPGMGPGRGGMPPSGMPRGGMPQGAMPPAPIPGDSR